FEDIGQAAGISPITAQYVSWGTGIYDFDNDGVLEILTFHGGPSTHGPREHSGRWGGGEGGVAAMARRAGGRCCVGAGAGGGSVLRRLRQRREGGCVPGDPGGEGPVVSQRVVGRGTLGRDSAQRHQEQSRWDWRAAGSDGGRQEANAGARSGVGISFAGRR